jgi:uncharacterized membrane protein
MRVVQERKECLAVQPQRSAAPVTQEKKERVAALDWLKGALVIFMVIYHSLNYSGEYTSAAFRLMAFLPPDAFLQPAAA